MLALLWRRIKNKNPDGRGGFLSRFASRKRVREGKGEGSKNDVSLEDDREHARFVADKGRITGMEVCPQEG